MFIFLAILSMAFLVVGVLGYRRTRASFGWVWISGVVAAGVAVGFFALLAVGIAYSRPESGIGLASVKWLDSRASDICYYRANDFGGAFAYEFSITSTGFITLSKERSWQIAPLSEPRDIWRYTFFLPETDARRQKPFVAKIERGLFFVSRQPNGGGITVLYDTNTLRAYVFESSR